MVGPFGKIKRSGREPEFRNHDVGKAFGSGAIRLSGGIEWQSVSGYPQGSFALKFGPFSGGVRFAEGKTEFRLFPTDHWLNASAH